MNQEFEKLTINVIYVRDTPKLLLPFLQSLILNSRCNYRLISNGCTSEEEGLLNDFAKNQERLSYLSLESEVILKHHEVLHYLLDIEKSPWFAFMDSDIFAKGSFLPELGEVLENNDAVFTGLPLWHEETELKMPESFKIMGGRYFMSHNDHLLGLSYMAIYKTAGLIKFIQETGIDLRRYYWNEIPVNYQSILNKAGLQKQMYDTAKVLNILWQHNGGRMAYEKVESLIHLGGVSGEDNQNGVIKFLKNNILRVVPSFLSTSVKTVFGISNRISFRERMNIERLVKKRRMSARLLRHGLYSNTSGENLKIHQFLGSEVGIKFDNAISIIRPFINDFRNDQEKNVS